MANNRIFTQSYFSTQSVFSVPYFNGKETVSKMTKEIADHQRTAIKAFMKSKGLNTNSWTKKAKVSESSLRHFLSGKSEGLQTRTLEKLARALHTPVAIITGDATPSQVALVGYVGAGAKINCQNLSGQPIDWIEPHEIGYTNMSPNKRLFRVMGDSMFPVANDGDYLRFDVESIKYGASIDQLLNKKIVAITEDGTSYYKILKRGSKPNTYSLLSFNTPEIIEDVILSCAVFVESVIYN